MLTQNISTQPLKRVQKCDDTIFFIEQIGFDKKSDNSNSVHR